MDNQYSIEVVCLFCDSPLEKEPGVEFQSGDMIKCVSCGELNDYDAAFDFAKDKGIKLVKSELEKEIKAKLKGFIK